MLVLLPVFSGFFSRLRLVSGVGEYPRTSYSFCRMRRAVSLTACLMEFPSSVSASEERKEWLICERREEKLQKCLKFLFSGISSRFPVLHSLSSMPMLKGVSLSLSLNIFSISRYRARSGDMSHSTAGLHPRRMSARRNSALAGMKLHLSSGANILPHSRAFSTSLALSVLK